MDLKHPFVAVFKESYQKISGKEAVINGVPFGTDARSWKNIAGCPVLQYGPGGAKECHALNEFIEVDSYLKAILVYAQLILDWCEKNE